MFVVDVAEGDADLPGFLIVGDGSGVAVDRLHGVSSSFSRPDGGGLGFPTIVTAEAEKRKPRSPKETHVKKVISFWKLVISFKKTVARQREM
jgi:hypothetical protein